MGAIDHIQYLEGLEELAASGSLEDFILWPRTPIDDGIQAKIEQRVGVSDYQLDAPISRPALIIGFLKKLIQAGALPNSFSVLDIACGDGIVLWQIQKSFPNAACYGIDCNKGNFPAHAMVERGGVRLYKAYIQHLFRNDVRHPFDVVLMLNTYRDWKAADLRGHEIDLPELANHWFERNALYVILTMEREGRRDLRRLGFSMRTLGKGEDRARLVCASKHKLPRSLVTDIIKRWNKWAYPHPKMN